MPRKSYHLIAFGLAVTVTVWFVTNLWFKASPPAQIDTDLAKVINQFNLQPLQVRRFEADPKFKLGQALFFDPILSGPRDVACSTCHLLKHGTSDGLAKSIGVHGVGLGPERRLIKSVRQHPRHSLNLWNRDNNAVRALFWDGRVEVLSPERRVFRSPLGKDLPPGLENVLAVQALFPLVTTEEMLGEADDTSSASLPHGHAGLPNELVTANSSLSGLHPVWMTPA
jgi:cytochrome c peroxidase